MSDVEKALSLLAEMEQRAARARAFSWAGETVPRLVKAVRAVLEVHQKYQGCRRCNNPPDCDVCKMSYPCSTVRSIVEALGARERGRRDGGEE